MEEYLREILATEKEAKKLEDDAQIKGEQIIASARKKAAELLTQAEEKAQLRLDTLRTQSETEARDDVARLEAHHAERIEALKERYRKLHSTLVDKISIHSETIPNLSKD